MHRSKQHLYSITLSAVASSAVGTSRPSAFAVFMLMASELRPLHDGVRCVEGAVPKSFRPRSKH